MIITLFCSLIDVEEINQIAQNFGASRAVQALILRLSRRKFGWMYDFIDALRQSHCTKAVSILESIFTNYDANYARGGQTAARPLEAPAGDCKLGVRRADDSHRDRGVRSETADVAEQVKSITEVATHLKLVEEDANQLQETTTKTYQTTEVKLPEAKGDTEVKEPTAATTPATNVTRWCGRQQPSDAADDDAFNELVLADYYSDDAGDDFEIYDDWGGADEGPQYDDLDYNDCGDDGGDIAYDLYDGDGGNPYDDYDEYD